MKKGYEVEVSQLPKCDFCGKVAKYDGRTKHGPWANMCLICFGEQGVGLGVGKGQYLKYRSNGGDK